MSWFKKKPSNKKRIENALTQVNDIFEKYRKKVVNRENKEI